MSFPNQLRFPGYSFPYRLDDFNKKRPERCRGDANIFIFPVDAGRVGNCTAQGFACLPSGRLVSVWQACLPLTYLCLPLPTPAYLR